MFVLQQDSKSVHNYMLYKLQLLLFLNRSNKILIWKVALNLYVFNDK